MSLPEKAFPVSWDQFHRDARALAWRLAGVNGQWRAIVCITRGGLVPAAIISRELGVRLIETVCIASYHDYTSQGELAVLKEIAPTLLDNDGEGILVIDDLTDTGKTAGDRARDDAEGAFRHRLRQAERPAAGRHLRHRSVAGHLDLLSLGHGLHLPEADRRRPSRLDQSGAVGHPLGIGRAPVRQCSNEYARAHIQAQPKI